MIDSILERTCDDCLQRLRLPSPLAVPYKLEHQTLLVEKQGQNQWLGCFFVLTFPQAKLDVPVYMELPIGMEVVGAGDNRHTYVLKLNRSLYGLKQASMN